MDYVINRANELGLVMGLVTAKSWHVTDHPEKVFDEKNDGHKWTRVKHQEWRWKTPLPPVAVW